MVLRSSQEDAKKGCDPGSNPGRAISHHRDENLKVRRTSSREKISKTKNKNLSELARTGRAMYIIEDNIII